MNDTNSIGKSTEIHFDAELLVKALRYHLAEVGRGEEGILEDLPPGGFSARIARDTWANFDDEQRLIWLLEASQRAGANRGRSMGIGSRLRRAKQN